MNKHFTMSTSRIVLAVFVCLFGMNNLFAQTAVLQHEEEMSMFYGPDSFIAAYNAAVDEDVITLSEGNFNPCTISKSITVHGAGAYDDPDAGNFATYLFSLSIGGNACPSPIIEGICFENVSLEGLNNSRFLKCCFGSITKPHYYGISSNNVHIINCYIYRLNMVYVDNVINDLHIVNSVIWSVESFGGQNHVVSNSIIRTTSPMACFTGYNSIIIKGSNDAPTNTCAFYNCIGVKNGYEGLVFENSLNSTVVEYDNITDVFPAFVGEDIFNEEFILDEGIASSFLGNNGTEVGIHGGYYPYSSHPGYMRMQHCTVGDRTTDDGHLSVDIEVVTEE